MSELADPHKSQAVSDYIKRLEEDVSEAEAGDFVTVITEVRDLRSLLSEVDRYREALERAALLLDDLGWKRNAASARQALGENDV